MNYAIPSWEIPAVPVAGSDVGARRADRDDQLDLVMVVLRRRRIRDLPDGGRDDGDDCIRRLREKERRLLRRVAAHLLRVLGVVAADAEDVADGEARVGAVDRHGRGVPHRDHGVQA
jgi:hypothetical protein